MIYFDLATSTLMLLMEVFQKPAALALFSVINTTLEVTQTNTQNFYDECVYELSFDCRRVYFQHYLNDKHDNILRRIFIRDVQNNTQLVLYNPGEGNEITYFYNPGETADPIYLYNPEELPGLLDFQIVVPLDFYYDAPAMKANIEKFRLPGMRYEIVAE